MTAKLSALYLPGMNAEVSRAYMMKSIAIYGGSFNPIHLGHVEKLKRLNERCCFDEVYFLPCGQNAFKQAYEISSEHRLAMLKLALAHFDFKIDTEELVRPGKTYTVETLRNYRHRYGHDTSLSFIMGHDAFADFMRWHEYDEILNLAHVFLLSRPDIAHTYNPVLQAYYDKHLAIDLNLIHQHKAGFLFDIKEKDYPYSSTEIRTAIKAEKKPLGLDPRVYAYIQKQGLYR